MSLKCFFHSCWKEKTSRKNRNPFFVSAVSRGRKITTEECKTRIFRFVSDKMVHNERILTLSSSFFTLNKQVYNNYYLHSCYFENLELQCWTPQSIWVNSTSGLGSVSVAAVGSSMAERLFLTLGAIGSKNCCGDACLLHDSLVDGERFQLTCVIAAFLRRTSWWTLKPLEQVKWKSFTDFANSIDIIKPCYKMSGALKVETIVIKWKHALERNVRKSVEQ